MKNNFQFESILKNAKGDNKAFPKLGNVLMFFAKNLGLLTFANEIWPFAKKGGKSEVRFLPKELANIC